MCFTQDERIRGGKATTIYRARRGEFFVNKFMKRFITILEYKSLSKDSIELDYLLRPLQ